MSRTYTHTPAIYRFETEPINYRGRLVIIEPRHKWVQIGKHFARAKAAKSTRKQYRRKLRAAERRYAGMREWDNDAMLYVRGTRKTVLWDIT